ncbi:CHD3-type chromatin-remodeling factor PICKLE-like [Panicum miliaceum]|uniref:CHD3-type chromatin-remodeling factor PICKLE-like n=1 Tax=Panicum miliaceum TaxID=4540 RepID=A0A3L6RLY1_PANMI|nr:CHD3-type chromatin-remodeling factor PICKLE-like [Panicum miliaceum]
MPPARSSARGGRRGRGRGGRGRGAAAAAAGTRRKRDVDSEVVDLATVNRDECSPRMKRRTEEIASAEHTVEAGLEALSRDTTEEDCAYGGEPTPTRNLRRLRKQTVESNAADAKEHVAVDVKDSDTGGPPDIKDISNGVAESEAKVVTEIEQSSARDDGQKLGQHRRSKRLQAKLIGIQDLDGGDTDSDIFEDRHNSSEDEKRRLVPKRTKRLQRKYTSESANDKDSVAPRRRSKRYKLRTRSSPNDDGDDSDAVNYYGKAIQCRRMSKRLQEKQKVDHITFLMRAAPTLLRQCYQHLHLQSGTASSHIIRCQNSNCSGSFHIFCQDPPLQDGVRTSECSCVKSITIRWQGQQKRIWSKRYKDT